MKKCIILFLAALLLLAFTACGKTKPEQPITTQAPETFASLPESASSTGTVIQPEEITYLKASELVVNGIGAGTTREQLVAKLGEPLSMETDELGGISYDYGNVMFFFFDSDTVTSVNVNSKAGQTPRGIQAGDAFDEVIQKFPRENDYRTSPGNSFYGTADMGGHSYGYILDEGDYGDPTMIVVTERGTFLKVHFQNGAVDFMQLFI